MEKMTGILCQVDFFQSHGPLKGKLDLSLKLKNDWNDH